MKNIKKIDILLAILGIVFSIGFIGASAFVNETRNLPDVSQESLFTFANHSLVTKTDQYTVLSDITYPKHKNAESLDEISHYVTDGVISNEDKRFYQHHGFELRGIARACMSMAFKGWVQGGSTITMQLAKNTLLANTAGMKTIYRKFAELVFAVRIEKNYSKDQILLMYLNNVNYGNGCYGVKTAADYYFGKAAKDLTLAESAVLVAIAQHPYAREPIYHYDNAVSAKNIILEAMLEDGYISPEEYDQAVIEQITVKNKAFIYNGENRTNTLQADPILDGDDVYFCIEDVQNYFDCNIYYENQIRSYITTGNGHYEVFPLDDLICKDSKYFLPVSQLTDAYGIQIEQVDNRKVYVTAESQQQASANVNLLFDHHSDMVMTNKNVTMAPMWLDLVDGKLQMGNVNLTNYIEQYKETGSEIWPCILSSPDTLGKMVKVSRILNDYESREALVLRIAKNVELYDIQGLIIDFEYMEKTDASIFTRFIIDLKPRLEELGVKLAVCVTPPDGAPNWSLCYDIPSLANACDYIVFMGYNQTSAHAKQPGSNAAYDWVKTNVEKLVIRDAIDPKKIILNIPLYMNVWTEQEDGTYSLAQVPCNKFNHDVQKTWLEDEKQYYAEHRDDDGMLRKAWIEDKESIVYKQDLVVEYGLAGSAYWQLAFIDESYYDLFGNNDASAGDSANESR